MDKYGTSDQVNHISNLWGTGKGYYTQAEAKYIDLFSKMSSFTGGTVLEVGPGTGSYAGKLHDGYAIKQYTILDIESSINDSKSYLTGRGLDCEFVLSRDYEVLFNRKFDLFVSNLCLSETPSYYHTNIFNNILPNCERIMIIDGDDYLEGYNDLLMEAVKSTFTKVDVRDSGVCGCWAIYGEK